jgi:hypothetical protein
MFKPQAEVTLNASTYTAIPVDAYSVEKTFLLQCDSAIDVYLSDTLAGSKKITLKSGTSMAIASVPANQDGAYILLYAKAASATPKLQIVLLD